MSKVHSSLIAVFFLLGFMGLATAEAQERFTVQSGGRGMENAKHSAQIRQIQIKDGQQDTRIDGQDTRITAVEGDIERIADHAWKEISKCGIGTGSGGTGYKITWNPSGTGTWGCIQETDPTVKTFAKTDLPTCGAGQVLRSNGTQFQCTTSAGSSGFEVDPYVQDFARNTVYTINACASDEVLTMTNKRLRCIKSQDLNITETDPTVQPFAKAALPECAAGQVLTTGVGGGGVAVLRCVTDTDGGYAEIDPSVGTITNNKWCIASGGKIHCTQNPPVLTETDPKVGTLTNARWCYATGGKVVCDRPAPAGDNLGNHIATQNIRLNDKWLSGDGADEGIYIDSQGRVGIGTKNIGMALEVFGSIRSDSSIRIKDRGAMQISGDANLRLWAADDLEFRGNQSGQSGAPPMMIILKNGNVGIATVTPTQRLHVVGNGLFTGTLTASAYYQSSDRALKENITPISNPFALLNAIEGKRYTWKDSKKPAYGVIAQDVEKVMPEAVQTADDGTKTVEYSQLIAPMIEAVKQLESRVRYLESVNSNTACNDGYEEKNGVMSTRGSR